MAPDATAALEPRQLVAALALLLGGVLVVAGLVGVFRDARKHTARAPAPETQPGPDSPSSTVESALTLAILALIVLAGAWLRLDDITAKTLTHTEAIIPNIQWPPDSWPPTRTSFYDTFWWHFHGEGHPQGHYFFMWAWTKVFGTGLLSLRLPSALFGIGSILLTWWLGSLTLGRRTAVLAAGLVAFNGLHIYFSQYARMFMMASFLALLSTVLLVGMVRARERRALWEAGYVLAAWLGLYTLTFLWTILAAQMLWLVLQRRLDGAVVRRGLALQALVVMLGTPSLAHVIYRGDDVTLPGPSLRFLAQYLSFGFVLERDEWSIPPRSAPTWAAVGVLALALLLLVRGILARRDRPAARAAEAPGIVNPHQGWSLVVALGSALVVVGLTVVALRHHAAMAAVVPLPFLALAAPAIGGWMHGLLRTRPEDADAARGTHRTRPDASVVTMLAFLPPVIVFALSFWTSMLTSRAFLVFVPFLLILIAGGAVAFARRRALAPVVVVALVAIHVASVVHWRRHPSEQFDYAELGRGMASRIQPGDLVLVQPELWVITPLYYYLGDEGHSYVTRDYAEAVADHPDARVWLLYFDSYQWGSYGTTTDEMVEAIEGYHLQEQVEARRARARLYVRDGA